MSLSNEEFERIKKLWAEAYLKLTEMGQIIGKHTKVYKENLGLNKIEVSAVIKRKDGSVRKTQEYEFENNKLTKRTIKGE